MMKTSITKFAVLALVACAGVAQAEVWTGAGDGTSYEDANNWDPSTNAFPGTIREINGAFTVTRDVDVTADRTYVQGGATLNVTAGTHFDSKAGNSVRNFVGNGSEGTVNVSGATTLYDIGHCLGIAHSSNSDGTVNLTSGTLNIGRGSRNSLVGGYGGNFSLGHSISIGGNISNTDVTGLMEISGGSLVTRTGIALAKNGTLSLVGSDASTIILGGSGDDAGWFIVSPDGLLKVTADIGGITRIFVEEQDNDSTINPFAEFAAGSLLDLTNTTSYGGTWTLLEVENGSITNNGLALAPGVDTNIWSFAIDNSGANGKLIVTAEGDPAPVLPDATLTVGDTRKQMMRYGLDYERLWFWYGSQLAPVPQWSVNDCNIDYIRCAMNSGYELTENVFDLSEYTDKIIPMMTAMQDANPNIKWFASPRPLNEAVSGASWQPYPLWVTGASSYTAGDYDFNDIKCAEYMIKYLLLMKSYGFKITYMDFTNEWQTDGFGGRITQSDCRDIVAEFQNYLASPWEHPAIPGLVLTEEDFPLMIAPSSWNYQQGGNWIDSLDTQAKKDAIDIAGAHNTDKTGTAQSFADDVATYCNPGTEIWETEQHGWKSTSSANEVTSFSFYMESIRAGFTGINGWLAIGTTSQGHCYLLNSGGTVTRNVKYYIFKKLSNTSNYGYNLDINEPVELNNTVALIRENLLTVWVNNTSIDSVLTEIDFSDYVRDASDITYTRWNESLSVEGVEDTATLVSSSNVIVDVEGESLYCIEIPLADPETNFPFVQAENYATESGISVLPCNDAGGGDMVGFSDVYDYVSYDLDITKTYTQDIAFRVSSESANIRFDIYNGSNLLASVDRVATGGAQKWTTLYETLPLDGGPATLYIVAMGGGWNLNWIKFDQQFYLYAQTLDNLALGQTYDASNVYEGNPTYGADKAFDGNTGSRWATDTSPAWLEVDFGTPTSINGVTFHEYGNRTTSYEIQYYDGTWNTAFVGGNPNDGELYSFPTVTGTKFRYQSITSTGNPSIYELELYYNPYYAESDPAVALASLDPDCVSLSWSGVPGSTYALQRSTNLVTDAFSTTIESGIPVHEGTNVNTVATPDDAGFYRVILE